ncbi:MAG: thioredoxin-disulfide reductase [Marinifilaceae bacterium]|jgi:thioredoxin reductase (NADPH)|nr:thioredoxin-disulfide reductase [Marinifilaceae bacterium]
MLTNTKERKEKCVIIGSGPAGYTAAIYTSRADLEPLVIEGVQPGGQLTTTTDIDNFPGYPKGVNGNIMMDDLKEQSLRFGARCLPDLVTNVDFSVYPLLVNLSDGTEIKADSVILATGASARYLGLESEEKFKGSGVSACATCDGFFYKNTQVAVVGGGDTAAEESIYLSKLASKVFMIVREDYLMASRPMIKRLNKIENIEIFYEHTVKEVVGDLAVESILVNDNKNNKEIKLDVDGIFVAIGHKPNSDLFKSYIDLNEEGYVKTQPETSITNIPGVFACGDLKDPRYKQAITAAASGCKAAMDAEKFLSENNC